MTTAARTKPKPTAEELWARVDELLAAVADAPSEMERMRSEHRQAQEKVIDARAELRNVVREGGARRLAAARTALREAEAEVDEQLWEVRRQVAHEAPVIARQNLDAFVDAHWEELAGALVEPSRAAATRIRAAMLEWNASLAQWEGVKERWRQIADERLRDELPAHPEQSQLPMPASLRELARTKEAGDGDPAR
jgi:hypothetical protein